MNEGNGGTRRALMVANWVKCSFYFSETKSISLFLFFGSLCLREIWDTLKGKWSEGWHVDLFLNISVHSGGRRSLRGLMVDYDGCGAGKCCRVAISWQALAAPGTHIQSSLERWSRGRVGEWFSGQHSGRRLEGDSHNCRFVVAGLTPNWVIRDALPPPWPLSHCLPNWKAQIKP